MASDDMPGKVAPASARSWGARSIGSLLPAVTRPAFRSRSAAGAQIMADWPAIVGPALARISAPRHLNRGTLTLACTGPVALELQHLAGQLAERINAHYGRTLVEQLRFVQSTVAITDPALTRPRQTPPPPVDIPDIKDGALRDALASLGGAVDAAARQAANGTMRRGAPKRVLTRTRLPEA